MACEYQYFFLALVESKREEFISHISAPHCPGNRDGWLFFSMVAVSSLQSSQGGGEELCVLSQGCTASVEGRHMDTWEQERVSWFCVECCVQGMCGWRMLGIVLVVLAVEAQKA